MVSKAALKEDEDGDNTRISSHEKVVSDLDESCFSAMMGTETGLELFIHVVIGEMGMELRNVFFFLKSFEMKGR